MKRNHDYIKKLKIRHKWKFVFRGHVTVNSFQFSIVRVTLLIEFLTEYKRWDELFKLLSLGFLFCCFFRNSKKVVFGLVKVYPSLQSKSHLFDGIRKLFNLAWLCLFFIFFFVFYFIVLLFLFNHECENWKEENVTRKLVF